MYMRPQAGIGMAVALMVLILVPLSGCIGPQEVAQRLLQRLEAEKRYEWRELLSDVQSFRFLDIVNTNAAKIERYPPLAVKEGTRYLHLHFNVSFSNLVNPEWRYVTTGYVNITIVDPAGVNRSRDFNALGMGNEYKEFFYFIDPLPGNWSITVTVRGIGEYTIFAQVYEPV